MKHYTGEEQVKRAKCLNLYTKKDKINYTHKHTHTQL